MKRYFLLVVIYMSCSPLLKYEATSEFKCTKDYETGYEYYRDQTYSEAVRYFKSTLECDSILLLNKRDILRNTFQYLYESFLLSDQPDSAAFYFLRAKDYTIAIDTSRLSNPVFWDKHIFDRSDSIRLRVRWPKNVSKDSSAKIVVSVFVDEFGNTSDVRILQVVGDSTFANAASSVFWDIKWNAATWHGRRIKSYFTMPLIYRPK